MPDTEATQRAHAQVQDAYELARYVIENGVKDANDQPLAFDNIKTIEATAAALGIIDVDGGNANPKPITNDEWAAFEEAYYKLAIATSPVTAETLRNTRYAVGAGNTTQADSGLGLSRWWSTSPPAQRFTWWLWFITIALALFVVETEAAIDALGMTANVTTKVKVAKDLLESLQPWAFGGLGACAYLLRSGHRYIYARSFDLRRKPEYLNRILLGAISGGAIILFADYLTSESDTLTHIGNTALGFIAGYSTDFLFNTVERIVTAIFPKVSVETVPRDQSPKRPAKPSDAGGGDGGQGANDGGGGGGPGDGGGARRGAGGQGGKGGG